METGNIELFLRKFSDQNLANLQAAAEDGRLAYCEPCSCLVHYYEGNYDRTAHCVRIGPLARKAEDEYCDLGLLDEPLRRERILPLIAAEWARRAALFEAHAEEVLEAVVA